MAGYLSLTNSYTAVVFLTNTGASVNVTDEDTAVLVCSNIGAALGLGDLP